MLLGAGWTLDPESKGWELRREWDRGLMRDALGQVVSEVMRLRGREEGERARGVLDLRSGTRTQNPKL